MTSLRQARNDLARIQAHGHHELAAHATAALDEIARDTGSAAIARLDQLCQAIANIAAGLDKIDAANTALDDMEAGQ